MSSEVSLFSRGCQWLFGTSVLILAAFEVSIISSASAFPGKTAVNFQAARGKQMAPRAVRLQVEVFRQSRQEGTGRVMDGMDVRRV